VDQSREETEREREREGKGGVEKRREIKSNNQREWTEFVKVKNMICEN
jgi:hypothetical protein